MCSLKCVNKSIVFRRDNSEKLTQKQLLEEAKETELLNIQSLEKYHQLELEKKKTRVVKKTPTGPTIRYLSTSMPLIQEVNAEAERINVEEDEEKEENQVVENGTVATVDSKQSCERTFITFSNENFFETNFSRTKITPLQKNFCPITRYNIFIMTDGILDERKIIIHLSFQAKSQILRSGDSATVCHPTSFPDFT